MNLYIETENNAPKNHPALEDNLLQAFGSIPPHWEPFIRIPRPDLKVYEILVEANPTYQKINGVWIDVWAIRNMTTQEKTAKQQAVRDIFSARAQAENWSAWVLDEATCTMVPPIPRPAPDQVKIDARIWVFWCGADNNWKDTPPQPDDNNQYKFDFFSWDWVVIS
jgi:hypothetical protein